MKKLLISTLALFTVLASSAQSDLVDVYTQAVEAYNAKNFAAAAHGFEQVIDQGMDSNDDEVLGWVGTARSTLPRAYFMLGGMAFQQDDFDGALTHFEKSAELAELYGNMQQAGQSKGWIANVYKKQGGDAFNAQEYAKAAEIYEKGYAADARNTEMALNLAMSYSELAVANTDLGLYRKGMEVYRGVAALDNPKFAEDAASAKEQMALYTNNMMAKMQGAGNHDAVVAMTDEMIAADANDALAHKIRMQTLYAKKDYLGVVAAAPAAVDAQTNDADRSDLFYLLGATFNARSQTPQALDAFKKVTVGPNAAAAKQIVEQLSKNVQ